MSDKDELDRILGAFPCDFKPEEYGSRICTYCGESAGELRHRIKSELQSYIAQHTKEAERRARIDELKALLDAEVIKPQYHNMYAQHIKEMEK